MDSSPAKPRPSLLRRALRAVLWLLLGTALLGMIVWAGLAICYASSAADSPRYIRAATFVVASLGVLLLLRPRKFRLPAFGLMFAAVLGWFFALQPSNDRDWAPEVAVLPWADIKGDQVVIHNVRNFDYRTETDFTPRWEDRSYDLSRLRSVDLILSYWSSESIAHAIASFGFDDGRYLAVSIETRKERSESYSAVQGFFRQYELIYVCADERDLLRLRTNYRHERVYIYRTRAPAAHARAVLLSYLEKVNSLRDKPEFYNALTTNCATSIIPHARAGRPTAHLSWEILLSGYAAHHAYRNGSLDDSMSFEELRKRSCVNEAAQAADQDAEFSSRIRAGLPVPPPRRETSG